MFLRVFNVRERKTKIRVNYVGSQGKFGDQLFPTHVKDVIRRQVVSINANSKKEV